MISSSRLLAAGGAAVVATSRGATSLSPLGARGCSAIVYLLGAEMFRIASD